MKSGEYIRHTTDGIQKIERIVIENGTEYLKCTNNCEYRGKNVMKHAVDWSSLIEVGDYINGHLIIRKYNDNQYIIEDYTKPEKRMLVNKKNIKTVLTKEQLDTHCYKPERFN